MDGAVGSVMVRFGLRGGKWILLAYKYGVLCLLLRGTVERSGLGVWRSKVCLLR